MSEQEKTPRAPFIIGSRVSLMPLSTGDDAGAIARWCNDPTTRAMARVTFPMTIEAATKYLKDRAVASPKSDAIIMGIWQNENEKVIGYVELNRINLVDRNATINLHIGERDYRGRGLANEAARLMLQYAFEELNLHKIRANILADDVHSNRIAEKLGFTLELVHQKHEYYDYEYHDLNKWAIFDRDWFAITKKEAPQ